MQPPQEPYSQQPYQQPPYDQTAYSPQPAYGLPSLPPPRGTVSLDVISDAWTLFKPGIGPWILAMVAYFGIPYVIGAVRGVLQLLGQNANSSVLTVIAVLLQIVSWGVTQLLLAGLAKMAVQNVRNRVANINEMWTVTNVWGKILLSSILQGIIYFLTAIPGLAFMLYKIAAPLSASGLLNPAVWTGAKPPAFPPALIGSIFGGLLTGFLIIALVSIPIVSLMFLTFPLLVDRKLGPWAAIAVSFGALKKHFGKAILLSFVLGLINIGGVLACCVGLLFTFPLTQIAFALVYRDLFGEGEVASPQNTIYAPPPIANPNS